MAYCINCGATLREGAEFCASCGTKNNTVHMATAPMAASGPVAAQAKAPKNRTPVIIAAIGAVAAVAVAGILAFSGVLGGSSSVVAAPAATTTASAVQTAADNASAKAAAEKAAAEAANQQDTAAYQALTRYYDALADFDGRIAECATQFNNNWAQTSSSVRRDYLNAAVTLKNEINNNLTSLQSTSVTSKYSSTKSEIVTCYSDCQNRISVIVEAWNNSLKYSNPKNFEASILAPIKRDSNGQNNRYFADFNDRYPNCKPSL